MRVAVQPSGRARRVFQLDCSAVISQLVQGVTLVPDCGEYLTVGIHLKLDLFIGHQVGYYVGHLPLLVESFIVA
jgi:hypothetical protein